MLSLVKPDSVVLEIGVFRGEFSKEIISIVKPKELYLVDIWSGTWGSGDKDGNNHVDIADMEQVYLGLWHQVKNKSNIHVVRSKSVPFLLSCEDKTFDVIYVDGDHTREAVYNDLVNSFTKIKPNGLLMGHDYHYQIHASEVRLAIDDFCRVYNQKVEAVTEDGCPSFCIVVNK